MTNAEKMLKDNGFNECSMEEVKYIKESRQWRVDGELTVTFNENKTVDISFNNCLPIFVDSSELKAIYERGKELGWYD